MPTGTYVGVGVESSRMCSKCRLNPRYVSSSGYEYCHCVTCRRNQARNWYRTRHPEAATYIPRAQDTMSLVPAGETQLQQIEAERIRQVDPPEVQTQKRHAVLASMTLMADKATTLVQAGAADELTISATVQGVTMDFAVRKQEG
jgi:hypothetical protein